MGKHFKYGEELYILSTTSTINKGHSIQRLSRSADGVVSFADVPGAPSFPAKLSVDNIG
jgi:hypothetical protein